MKLLFDENLSPRLPRLLQDLYPDSAHVEDLLLRGHSDEDVWSGALRLGYVIVSKDTDFRERAFLFGGPPKVIWLSVGNAGTDSIHQILRDLFPRVRQFSASDDNLLVLLPPSSPA